MVGAVEGEPFVKWRDTSGAAEGVRFMKWRGIFSAADGHLS